VGHSAAKRALLLLAVEPRLRGALIASESGSAKSTLARAFGSLLPHSEPSAADRAPSVAASFNHSNLDAEVVEVPLNITEDRLLGGLDLERTIATGRRLISAGLLARADRRVLYVDDVNLLDLRIAAHMAHAMDSRKVRIEREGLSVVHAADFTFVGTYNAAEGQPCSLLRERVGMIVDARAECSCDERAEIIERAFRFDRDPFSFADDFFLETAQIKSVVEEARARLPRVRLLKDQTRQLVLVALRVGVEGNRADVFALRAARANAALAGRDSVNEDDLVTAIRLVLAPRATTLPNAREATEDPARSSQPKNAQQSDSEHIDSDRDSRPDANEDLIIRAIDARLPEDLLSDSRRTRRPSRVGRRFEASASSRGRYVRSVTQRTLDAPVAIDATLRAAAPEQLWREMQRGSSRKPADGREENRTSDKLEPGRVRIEPSDLRFKGFEHRSGILFILAVDASGSMALNRMAQAKGALTRLLRQAYLCRDKVALISFRGEEANVLLAPTRGIELAKRLVDALPAGGGTPLSAGVAKALEMARLARLQGMPRAVLVLFTDGRANVSIREGRAAIGEELRQLGRLLAAEDITAVVVDTKSRFVSSGDGQSLAQMLKARYFYLQRSDPGTVYDAIASVAGRRRQKTDG